MGLRTFVASTGLVILFVLALFIFMVEFLGTNNPDALTSLDPSVNRTFQSLKERASELDSIAGNAQDLVAETKPSAEFIFLIAYSFLAIPLLFLGFLVKSMVNIVTLPFVLLFGGGNSPFYIIFTIVNSILLITVVILIVKRMRGEQDTG